MTQDEKTEIFSEMMDLFGHETDERAAYEARVHAMNGAIQVEQGNGWQAVLTAARAFQAFLTGGEMNANVTPFRVQIAPVGQPEATVPDVTSPLEEFALSCRALNCLRTNGYLTAGDVMRATDANLLRMPNFGRLTLREVRALMPALRSVSA